MLKIMTPMAMRSSQEDMGHPRWMVIFRSPNSYSTTRSRATRRW